MLCPMSSTDSPAPEIPPLPDRGPAFRPDYDSPTAIKAFLEAEGLAMSKRLGQNFLVDSRARARILAELGAPPGAAVWEIGPGIGAMTAMALDSGLDVTAFEIDHGFARALRRIFGADPAFRLVEGDFLKTWAAWARAEGRGGRSDAVFGNLPYNASNAMVAALIEGPARGRLQPAAAAEAAPAVAAPAAAGDGPARAASDGSGHSRDADWAVPGRMVFTVQKECARRMAASPGRKDYSAFSVLCASACDVRIAFDLGASSFWPAPKVTSSVVVLAPRNFPLSAGDRAGFSAFVRASFSSRRKKLRNNLKVFALSGRPLPPEALSSALEGLGLGLDLRAEALSPEELAAVYAAVRRIVLPSEPPSRIIERS
jgi:16S rRNA (adenine1518-N6/adenine1519-N6)-dimethyltransferase